MQGPHVVPPDRAPFIKMDDMYLTAKEIQGLEKAQTQQLAMIPFIIRIYHPKMRSEQFMTLQNNHNFLSRLLYVCEDCYLYMSRSSTVSGKFNYEVREKNLFGCQNLNPNKTNRTKMADEFDSKGRFS